jgi:hypothetical protein
MPVPTGSRVRAAPRLRHNFGLLLAITGEDGLLPSDDRYDEGLVMRAVAAKVGINSLEFKGEGQFGSGGAAWKKAIRLPEMFDAGSSVTVELRSIACRRSPR